MKKCELCKFAAKAYCESDQASLCWNCDAKVHAANFLVARHSRSLLCNTCQLPTPWRASGAKLGHTVSVCESCANCGRGGEVVVEEEEEEIEEEEEEEEEVEEEEEGRGRTYEEEEEEEEETEEEDDDEEDEGENQVVPWASTTPPPAASSSSSEESSCACGSSSSLKRMRDQINRIDGEANSLDWSKRPLKEQKTHLDRPICDGIIQRYHHHQQHGDEEKWSEGSSSAVDLNSTASL